jgi:DeoR/GlpR family transcriptional regulator of sugar metabolism
MLIEERRRRLLEAVNAKGSLTVAEAEKALDVSRMTVHRDLDVLAAQGLVRKVHGGVVALTQNDGDIFDPRARPFEERQAVNRDAKRAIARHVAKLIAKAHTVVLDASSTVYFMSDALGQNGESRDMFIVTGGLPLFSELLRRRDGLRVALHGGEPHARTGSLVGPLALASLGDMRFDFAVMSALGILEEEGTIYVSNPEEVELKRAYVARARKKILAIDSSKLGQSGAYLLGPLGDFDWIVTEKGPVAPGELGGGRRRR